MNIRTRVTRLVMLLLATLMIGTAFSATTVTSASANDVSQTPVAAQQQSPDEPNNKTASDKSGAAPATNTDEPNDGVTLNLVFDQKGAAKATAKAVSTVNTNAEGKIVGAWAHNPGPKGHWKPQKAKHVPFAKSYNAGVRTCKPFRLHRGQWMPWTLKRRDGVLIQVRGGHPVRHPWSLFDQGKSCQDVRHRGYYNDRTGKWEDDCVNPKPTPNMPSYPPNQVVEVKQHGAIWHHVSGEVSVEVGGKGYVKLEQPGCEIELWFDQSALGEAAFNLRVQAATQAKAKGKAVKMASSSEAYAAAIVAVKAQARTWIKAKCTNTPPNPPGTATPDLDVDAQGCVGQGNRAVINVTVDNFDSGNDDAINLTGTASADGQSTPFTAPPNRSTTVRITGIDTIGSVTVTVSFNEINRTFTRTVQVDACDTPPPPEHQNPLAEYFIGEHAVDKDGTMPVFGYVDTFDGAVGTLASPVVTPSRLGAVYNWRSVDTERDGVTPCRANRVCYQGYFRASEEGNGQLTGRARDNQGGEFTPDPVNFVVVFIDHPET